MFFEELACHYKASQWSTPLLVAQQFSQEDAVRYDCTILQPCFTKDSKSHNSELHGYFGGESSEITFGKYIS